MLEWQSHFFCLFAAYIIHVVGVIASLVQNLFSFVVRAWSPASPERV